MMPKLCSTRFSPSKVRADPDEASGDKLESMPSRSVGMPLPPSGRGTAAIVIERPMPRPEPETSATFPPSLVMMIDPDDSDRDSSRGDVRFSAAFVKSR
jgi:hypothetical protein